MGTYTNMYAHVTHDDNNVFEQKVLKIVLTMKITYSYVFKKLNLKICRKMIKHPP